jgi:hypothetical protein
MSDSDKNMFYSRLNVFGEYSFQNRIDTLYVLQLSFIVMLAYICLYYLHKFGLFSTYAFYIVATLLVVMLVLIILNRAIVLPKFRSKNNWNEYKFDKLNPPDSNTIKRVGVDGGTPGSTSPPPAGSCNTGCVPA